MPFKKNQPYKMYRAALYHDYTDYFKSKEPSLLNYARLNHLNKIHMPLLDHSSYRRQLGAPARLRILHSASISSTLDVHIDNILTLPSISFEQCSRYQTLTTGTHRIDVFENNRCGPRNITKKIHLESGKYYTLIVMGKDGNLRLIALEDSPEVPAGEAKIRFFHLCPEIAEVDIAVKNRDVIFPKLKFLNVTDYLGITPMKLELEARKVKKTKIAFTLNPLKLNANIAYTAVISSCEVLLLEDLISNENE